MAATTTLEENKRIAKRLIDEVHGEKNLDLIDELVTPDYVDHGQELEGPEAFKDHIRGIKRMSSDHTASSDLQMADGDYVFARWTANGTNDGPFGDAEPSGNPFEFTGVSLYRIEEGQIAESWVYWDSMQAIEQLDVGVHG